MVVWSCSLGCCLLADESALRKNPLRQPECAPEPVSNGDKGVLTVNTHQQLPAAIVYQLDLSLLPASVVCFVTRTQPHLACLFRRLICHVLLATVGQHGVQDVLASVADDHCGLHYPAGELFCHCFATTQHRHCNVPQCTKISQAHAA
eukprot:jgi/Chrzof1/9704/Cz04g12230.t1